ncbi:MAG: chemotaxis protein CheW [Pseudomonadota bacterium]|jgi:purine-binding chemotaxis protein CheW|uniref:Purine-binding chemotaxis protein CheW n=1 Tax=Marinomonas communis TaxID=28254 RepID=A0A4R6WZC9_9GAMM|nr:chemotaxis protein CheW [Marinomonas communis]MEC8081106.1 chemotaxis protein CheW [Pseudomonadota bacterium]MEC8484053.1 chemotaxis protein CheW [Pseudomonadota bacterium]TDR06621.1 purine-binding chemotaxis protein CheW [Marinomonas communis]|tara:strand:+ start:1349 stop:1861 length:513 start_codon:yes stop_codon:yes gene_type:complete
MSELATIKEAGNLPTESKKGELLQYLTFKLLDETYGINVMQIKEVLRYNEIAPVPGAQSYVLGIVNLRGNVVTVIDTRVRFSLPECTISDDTRIIIIEHDGEQIGMLVDAVKEVFYLYQGEIEQSPSVGNDEALMFIQGVYQKDEELVILLDLNKMIDADNEQLAIGSMI